MISVNEPSLLALYKIQYAQLFVLLRGSGFGRGDESGADPYALSAKHEGSSKTPTIIDASCSNDEDLKGPELSSCGEGEGSY